MTHVTPNFNTRGFFDQGPEERDDDACSDCSDCSNATADLYQADETRKSRQLRKQLSTSKAGLPEAALTRLSVNTSSSTGHGCDLEKTIKNFSLEVEFTQFVLEEPQGKAAFRMSGEGRRNIKKLVVTVGNRDYEAPTPARPVVVLPLRALPVDALLSMEYEGKSGMHKVTDYPITIRTAEKGSRTCAVM